MICNLILFTLLFALPTIVQADLTPDCKVEYKTVDDVSLKLNIFNPPNHKATDNTPAIVFFFGGGWVGGSTSHLYPQSEYLASRGMVAICAEYRTGKGHGTTPQECVKDGKSAIRYVRAHAKELGIDPDKLAAGGGSAGGHVAAATGNVDGFNEDGEDTAVSARPNALVLFNPVYDNSENGYGFDRVSEYWEAFSPMHNLDKDTPPTTVFLGTQDKLIPVATAKEYKKRMDALDIRSDLHLYENQPHGFFNQGKANNKYNETVYQTDLFLTELGYLKGEPTIAETTAKN